MSRHLLHKRSSDSGTSSYAITAKLPTPSTIEYGEIAVNFRKGSETLSIRNSNNEIVPFPNNEVMVKSVGLNDDLSYSSDKDVLSASTTVASAVDTIVDELIKDEIVVASAFGTIKESVGLNEDLSYTPSSSSKYISGATSVTDALTKLDNAIKSGGGISSGSTVTVNAIKTSGEHIATIGVDGTDYEIYASSGGTTSPFKYNANGTGIETVSGDNTASGSYSHAEGQNTNATGNSSHAEGRNTTASGVYSHAEGSGTTASGLISHAEGSGTTASGEASHAEGVETVASGEDSHAEGVETVASGPVSHAEGETTSANGYASHAEGMSTAANGEYSHSEGDSTRAYGEASHAGGIYSSAVTDASFVHGQYLEAKSTTAETAFGKYNVSSGDTIFSIGNGADRTHRSNALTVSSGGNVYVQKDIYLNGKSISGVMVTNIGLNDDFTYSSNEGILSSTTTVTDAIDVILDELANDEFVITNSFASVKESVGLDEHLKYIPSVTTKYISGATSVNDALNKLDYAIKTGGGGTSSGSTVEVVAIKESGDTSEHIATINIDGTDTMIYAGKAESPIIQASGSYGLTVKYFSGVSTGYKSISLGYFTSATSHACFAEGSATTASNDASHAEGGATTASGKFSHAEGKQTRASGETSHAEGDGTTANGYASHAEGVETVASGDCSHAEGSGTTANGNCSHAEGNATTASGSYSHAEGNATTASGNSSHAEGKDTVASGTYSHTEGYDTTASGSRSHAEGDGTTASGESSHAEGDGTLANGKRSHAEGNGTRARGDYSHSEGDDTVASGTCSHVEGWMTIAHNEGEHAQGCCNKSTKTSDSYGNSGNTTHSIGIGINEDERKNAVEVMENGDIYIYGVGGYDGTNFAEAKTLQKMFMNVIPLAVKTKKIMIEGFNNISDLQEYLDGMHFVADSAGDTGTIVVELLAGTTTHTLKIYGEDNPTILFKENISSSNLYGRKLVLGYFGPGDGASIIF